MSGHRSAGTLLSHFETAQGVNLNSRAIADFPPKMSTARAYASLLIESFYVLLLVVYLTLLKIALTSYRKSLKLLHMVESTAKYPDFAHRLNDAMSDAGVTVTDLKTRLQVTYEMARRYTLGTAMPRDARLRAIGKIVNKSPSWLAFGDAGHQGDAFAKPKPNQALEKKWPLKRATPERFHALTPKQQERADAAIDDLLRGYEAERAKP